jgi:O-antigen/teichoic acid export membrane protein
MRLVGNLYAEMLLGLFLRGLGAISSFALLWLIARIYGAGVIGLYQLGLTTIVLLGTLSALGLPELVIRKLSSLISRGELGDARTTFRACFRYVLARGIVCAILLAALAVPFSRYVLGEPEAASFLIVFAPAALFLALLRLTAALLRTTGRVVASQSLEGVFYTSLAALSLAIAWALGHTGSPLLPVWFYVLGCGLAVLISWLLVRRVIATWPRGKSLIRPNEGTFIAAAPLTGHGGDWLQLLIITSFLGLEEGGIYRTAFQFCLVFQLVTTSFAIMSGPHLARAAGEGDYREVNRMVRSAGLIGAALCLPFAIACWVTPDWLLSLFGPEFEEGALSLQILVTAQIMNVARGPVGTALVMLHRERYVLGLEIVAVGAGVLAALALVGPFSIAGVAAGPLVSSLIRNVASSLKLRQVLAQGAPQTEAAAQEEVVVEPDQAKGA